MSSLGPGLLLAEAKAPGAHRVEVHVMAELQVGAIRGHQPRIEAPLKPGAHPMTLVVKPDDSRMAHWASGIKQLGLKSNPPASQTEMRTLTLRAIFENYHRRIPATYAVTLLENLFDLS